MKDILIKQVYEIVDSAKKELTSHILRLETKFDILEAGRVSGIEKDMAELKAEQKPIKMVVYGMIGLILVTVLGALLFLVLK